MADYEVNSTGTMTNEHRGTVRSEVVMPEPSDRQIRAEALRLGVSRANEDGGDALAYARRFLNFINDNEEADPAPTAERSGAWVLADFNTTNTELRQALQGLHGDNFEDDPAKPDTDTDVMSLLRKIQRELSDALTMAMRVSSLAND